jgi:transposase-like protein
MIPNLRSATPMPIMERMIVPDSMVYKDSYASDDPLDVSAFHHRRIHHGDGFAARETHINGIENFWSQAKRHLRRFNGIPRQSFQLFLSQYEWSFRGRGGCPPPRITQSSRKLRSFRLRLGCFSLRNAFASIWRMRSRVTLNCWPTSSSV